MPVYDSPGAGGLRKPVSPARAMFESTARTAVSMAVGALLTWLAGWLAEHQFNFQPSEEMEFIVTGIVWTVLSSLYAAAQRKFVPIQTDAPGAARTDVTSGGKVM
jgi:hypothetical protein